MRPLPWLMMFAGIAAAQHTAVDAARERQKRLGAVAVTYTMKEVIGPRPGTNDQEVILESTNHIWMDGVKFRAAFNHPQFDSATRRSTLLRSETFEDGEAETVIYPLGREPGGSPAAHVMPVRYALFQTLHSPFHPVHLFLRSADPRRPESSLGNLKPTGKTLLIDDLVTAEHAPKHIYRRDLLWTVPTRDHVIVRMYTEIREGVDMQTDIKYRAVEGVGFVPESWTTIDRVRGDGVLRTWTGRVTSFEAGVVMPPDQLEPKFPPGTLVSNGIENKAYRVQPDGSLRELDEFGRELREPEPAVSWVWKNRWRLAVAAMLILALSVFAVRSRRTRAVAIQSPLR